MRSLLCLAFVAAACTAPRVEWKPAAAPLLSRFAASVDPDLPLPEYPRPTLQRPRWMSLNGSWDFAELPTGEARPAAWTESILVPFPIESALSGIGRRALYAAYHRTFDVPADWGQQRVLLHFGAVDWAAEVYVNERRVGSHRGGYDAFSLDITDALVAGGPQDLVVRVFDPSSSGEQPRGKQVVAPEGIWYTPTSGIWQTVWLEAVARVHVESLDTVPDVRRALVRVTPHIAGASPDVEVTVQASTRGTVVGGAWGRDGETLEIRIPDPHLWKPADPFLYDLTVSVSRGGRAVDEVTSYFGMRSIEIGNDDKGVQRLLLNGEPVFQIGLLDQGFWPDGLYTAPTDEALRSDIELAKELGFNLLRKHVKVEPERWYHWCDTLGMLVWQDMPSGDNTTIEGKRQFERELERLVHGRGNHPSIVAWVVFNEGWGQFDTERVTAQVKYLDPSRLVSNASGWTDAKCGDIVDVHAYPGPGAPEPEPRRAGVLGEFGGLGLAIEGHTWQKEHWGYQGMESSAALTDRYVELMTQVWSLRDTGGLCAAVYTQLSDVETECNGLVTYDRALVKVDAVRVADANRGRVPHIVPLTPTAREDGVVWRYRLEAPPEQTWSAPDFDDRAWLEGPAGFGREGTPGAIVRTAWTASEIWLRREFTLDAVPAEEIRLLLHHDEDAEVYVNGVLAAERTGYTTAYEMVGLKPEAVAALAAGRNVIAIHCKQTTGGQYVDAGLVLVIP